MAWFRNERADDDGCDNWNRVAELVASGKTVEVYKRKEGGEHVLYMRVWTGKRGDGSNNVNANPTRDYYYPEY